MQRPCLPGRYADVEKAANDRAAPYLAGTHSSSTAASVLGQESGEARVPEQAYHAGGKLVRIVGDEQVLPWTTSSPSQPFVVLTTGQAKAMPLQQKRRNRPETARTETPACLLRGVIGGNPAGLTRKSLHDAAAGGAGLDCRRLRNGGPTRRFLQFAG